MQDAESLRNFWISALLSASGPYVKLTTIVVIRHIRTSPHLWTYTEFPRAHSIDWNCAALRHSCFAGDFERRNKEVVACGLQDSEINLSHVFRLYFGVSYDVVELVKTRDCQKQADLR